MPASISEGSRTNFLPDPKGVDLLSVPLTRLYPRPPELDWTPLRDYPHFHLG